MPRRWPIAIPHPHFMAFAPLDSWARLLLARGPAGWVPVRYWARLGFGLFTSAIGTALTLPERVVLAPVLAVLGRRSGLRLTHGPGVLVVLGYFRSGTTHLHYLLSCDPRLRTPTWCETLAPQGFWLSWSFLRVFMMPFVSAKRPQDDVGIGPDWPAEDDFAACNWALASSLPGRFVFPSRHAFYDRFHSLEGLSEGERRRWRRVQWAFCRKLAWLAGGRGLLLKTPSHTARVRELVGMFGRNVRFVHISREPGAVVRSNVSMAGRLSLYNLEDPPEGDDLEARLTREFVETERSFLEQAVGFGAGRVSRVRYEDLVADPLGELRRVYGELGMEWSAELERRAGEYLASVRDYRAASGARGEHAPAHADLEALRRKFGHDRPARPRVPLPPAIGDGQRARAATAVLAGLLVAVVGAVVWVAQAWVLHVPGSPGASRHDWLAWPLGVLIGMAVLRVARVGTVRLGLWAAGLTVLAFAAVSMPATFASDYGHRTHPLDYRTLPMRDWEWYHILKSSRVGSTAWNNLFWLFMGAVTAYRFASRKYAHPPGRG